MISDDPIEHYLDTIGYHPEEIADIFVGEKYLACHLKNGNLGVCAILNVIFPEKYVFRRSLDLHSHCDRILLNAWFNAKLNYVRSYPEDKDIFDFLSFDHYNKIVMVGYFASLVQKFQDAGIKLDIFDLTVDFPYLKPIDQLGKYILEADAIIMTSTSISNGTFKEIMKYVSGETEIFLLGPSTILDQDMYIYPNIRKIFGMVFTGNEKKVIETIMAGHGTPTFSKFGQKVYL